MAVIRGTRLSHSEGNNFQINRNSCRGDEGFDFLGDFGGERWAIEVKFYHS
jgi:hypothetical protein